MQFFLFININFVYLSPVKQTAFYRIYYNVKSFIKTKLIMRRFFTLGKQIMLAAVLFAGLSFTSCGDDKDDPKPVENTPENPTPENPTPENPTPENPTPENPVETPSGDPVDLTADMFMQDGETVDGNFILGEETDCPFGLGTPNKDKFADLSGYKTLTIEVSGDDMPRLFFNQGAEDSDRITVNSESEFWSVKSDGVIVIDIAALAAANNNVAHLNSIKASAYNTKVIIESLTLN